MTRTVRFTVPIAPIGKGRPRLGRGGRTYTPEATVSYGRAIAAQARAAMGCGQPSAEHLWRVRVVAFTPRPASRPRDMEAAAWKAGSAAMRRTKPDVDNVLKLVLDALNGVVWGDDAQVVSATVERWMAPADSAAGIDVLCEVVACGPDEAHARTAQAVP